MGSSDIHHNYSELMKISIEPDKTEGINIQDIAKCTGAEGGIQGKVVRFFNRLWRLDKGWITDAKVKEALGKLADNPEKQEQLKSITNSMTKLANTYQDSALLTTKWDTKSPTNNLSDLKKLYKNIEKFEYVKSIVSSNLMEHGTKNEEGAALQKLQGNAKEQLQQAIQREKTLMPLRDLNPLVVVMAPQSQLGQALKEYINKQKTSLTKENLNEHYQSFISDYASKKHLAREDIKKLVNDKFIKNAAYKLVGPLFETPSIDHTSAITDFLKEEKPTENIVNLENQKSKVQEKPTDLNSKVTESRNEFSSIFNRLDNISESAEMTKYNFEKLEKFEPVITEMTNEFITGLNNLKNNRPAIQLKNQADYLYKNQDRIISSMLMQIPDINIDSTAKSSIEETRNNLNNYGISLTEDPIWDSSPKEDSFQILDEAGNIKKKMYQFGTCTFKYLESGIEKELKGYVFYDPETKQVFSDNAPIVNCDVSRVSSDGKVATFADGCGWGGSSQTVAWIASKTAQDRVVRGLEQKPTLLRDAVALQINGVLAADKAVKEKNDSKTLSKDGSATLTQVEIVGGYGIFTSLGDSKCYIIREEAGKRVCIEPTAASRNFSADASDPGGRIGPNNSDNSDFRNLSCSVIKLKPGDKIILCSDGVHDNLDPESVPSEHPNYKKDDPDSKTKRTEAMGNKLLEITQNSRDIKDMSNKIDSYVSEIVKKEIIMQINKENIKNKTKAEVPGKLDHAKHIILAYNG